MRNGVHNHQNFQSNQLTLFQSAPAHWCLDEGLADPNKAGCPKKKRKYVTKKNYGKVPAYLANRIASAAKKKKRESPEEMAKCNHEGTRKYDSIHSVFTTTHSWSIFSQTILNGK